ncbi:MAG: hypothetical protein RR635_09600 [Oscillospiraceae bacterium]
MKKICLILALAFALALPMPQVAYANMAAPKDADIGSSITFEQNDTLSVLSEILDITVDGQKADIVATYKMKNITSKSVSTQTMFLSPNIKSSGVAVLAGGKDVPFTVESYGLNYTTKIKTDAWQYAVLTDKTTASRDEERTVDAINFKLDFEPSEEYDVVVSYSYSLGGYPSYDFDAKMGRIEYYLAPAAMWNDFGGITINLKLGKDMPVISSSNLEFKKIGSRTYQYVSDTLPKENLEIVVDENMWQNFFSTLKSPYLSMTMLMFSPLILIVLAAIIFIIWRLRKKKRHSSQ